MAPPPVILLLKAVAYMDRPHERERDLADIGYILDEAVSVPDRFTDLVIERGYGIGDAGTFLVGKALGAMARADELAALDMFLAKVRDAADRHSTHARMARVGPAAWRRDADLVLARIDAFEQGVRVHGAKTPWPSCGHAKVDGRQGMMPIERPGSAGARTCRSRVA